jgi:hypothetical protein
MLAADVSAICSAPSRTFLSMTRGELRLENLEVVIKSTDAAAGLAALVRVTEGIVHADGCTFSMSGHHPAGVAGIQLDGRLVDPSSIMCRLVNCHFRGAELIALDLRAPAGGISLDNCLLVGGVRPVIDISGPPSAKPLDLRFLHSTLVARQRLLRIRSAPRGGPAAKVRWLLWDSLMARYGPQIGGDMIELSDSTAEEVMEWKAVNCLYAGWPILLRDRDQSFPPSDRSSWRKLWRQDEGDAATEATWPSAVPSDPAQAGPDVFRVMSSPVAFTDTSGAGTIGCNVASLSPTRDGWLSFTYDQAEQPAYHPPALDKGPDIPGPGDGRYSGEQRELSRGFDLGEHIRSQESRLSRKIVLRLKGHGELPTSPIHVKDASLVLYFDPGSNGDPLVLVPKAGARGEALIEVEGGDCDIIGGEIRASSRHDLPTLQSLVKAQGGNLRITGCKLQRAPGQSPDSRQSLVEFHGSGETDLDRAAECTMANCLLLSENVCVSSHGPGARVRLQNCVAVSGSNVLRLEPGTQPGRKRNVQCLLDHNSVAAGQAVVHVHDVATLASPVEPIHVQARANVFVSPFDPAALQGGLLACDPGALTRGLVVWQASGNVYDNRLHYLVNVPGGGSGAARQTHAHWTKLWGPQGDSGSLIAHWPAGPPLDLNDPRLHCLSLPTSVAGTVTGSKPGAALPEVGSPVPGAKNP